MATALPLDYEPSNPRAPMATILLRGWAMTNWVAAAATAGTCIFLMCKWGSRLVAVDSMEIAMMLLIVWCYVTTLSVWGLQCWWYGESVHAGNTVVMRRARTTSILLCMMWLLGFSLIGWIRMRHGSPRFDSFERIGWWMISGATGGFVMGVVLTVAMLTWVLRRQSKARAVL